jgi:hypothetical protein
VPPYPHRHILSLVGKASLKVNQRRKECLGMALENQTVFHQDTVGNLSLCRSHVLEQEKSPFLEFQIGMSVLPIFTSVSLH